MEDEVKIFMITNFLNQFLAGYFANGQPILSFEEDEMLLLNEEQADNELEKLHAMGYTGLRIETKFRS